MQRSVSAPDVTADPITTAVIANGLNAVAEQMKVTLCRAAFSPVIYEMIDFACGIYDTDVRLLAQARALPAFLGTLGFCIESAVAESGGAGQLSPGDVIFTSYAFQTGSHAQDAAVIVPAFLDGDLVGYAAVKAHHEDLGAKDPYCTDTVDIFQEGAIFPAIKLYRAGELQTDLYRTLLANSRMPVSLEGDLAAEIAAARTGTEGLLRLIRRYGTEVFSASVERMFNAAEERTRAFISTIPDGHYTAKVACDNDGITDEMISFNVTVEVEGSDLLVDLTDCPDQRPGPINTPLAGTIAYVWIAIMAIAGGADLACEGHLRPITMRGREGSLLWATPPAPCFLCGWPPDQVVDAIHHALAGVLPEAIPAGSGAEICGMILWGDDGESLWIGGSDHPVGQGASRHADGSAPLMYITVSGIQTTPAEIAEARWPVRVERYELARDSAGAGRRRGGLGIDVEYRVLRDAYMTAIFERSRTPPWGLDGGNEGRANCLRVVAPDGESHAVLKVTRLALATGSLIQVQTGGGGGYGPPDERDPEAVASDVVEDYLSEAHARTSYPHAAIAIDRAHRRGAG
jgi:N-methylhydantoinase B